MAPPDSPPPRPSSSSDPSYWGRHNKHTTLTARGARFQWGDLMRTVADGRKRVVIRRSRYTGTTPPTTPAVVVPLSWWTAKTREHPPGKTDVLRSKPAALGVSALLDRVEDDGVHVQIQRLRDISAVFVPRSWYEEVAGVDISTPADRETPRRGKARG